MTREELLNYYKDAENCTGLMVCACGVAQCCHEDSIVMAKGRCVYCIIDDAWEASKVSPSIPCDPPEQDWSTNIAGVLCNYLTLGKEYRGV
jgi:hypothetical protein